MYGPQENHKNKMASVIYHFHNQILKENRVKLFEGSDKFIRDFIYIDDIVNIILHFYKNNISGIFNCGTGKGESFLSIAKIMQRLYNDAKIEFIPFPKELEGKYQKFTEANLDNLRDNGNYKEKFGSLEDGVTSYVKILKESGGYYR